METTVTTRELSLRAEVANRIRLQIKALNEALKEAELANVEVSLFKSGSPSSIENCQFGPLMSVIKAKL